MANNLTYRGNRLLEAFDSGNRDRLDSHFERVALKLGETLCESGEAVAHAYFPDGAVISLLTVLKNGSAIEAAVIGREGAFGIIAAVDGQISFNRSFVQLSGSALRIKTSILRREFERSEHIRKLFINYSETLFSQIQQTVACNAMHSTRQRICRWLLMMHDRANGELLAFTHEFLAHVLGVNRKSVTIAALKLQKEGLISYHRGTMQVLDRHGLELATCECYAVVKRHCEANVLPPQKSGNPPRGF